MIFLLGVIRPLADPHLCYEHASHVTKLRQLSSFPTFIISGKHTLTGIRDDAVSESNVTKFPGRSHENTAAVRVGKAKQMSVTSTAEKLS